VSFTPKDIAPVPAGAYPQEVSRIVTSPIRLLDENEREIIEVVYRLSRATEYREEDTSPHLHRMSHGAAALARALNLETKTVQNLFYAAPMHDVGKVGIPDRILLKPTKLVDWEWKIMKQHTTLGKRILEDSDVEILNVAEIVAYTHHERWDGTGYPQGLSGDDIPIEGRIISIVDVFDNLTSQRPYKDPVSVQEALETIQHGIGTQFDPKVADCFFRIQDQLATIKDEFEDCGESIFLQMVGRVTVISPPAALDDDEPMVLRD